MTDRLSRTRLLLGEDAQNNLKRAHVAVMGCGAVGSYTIETLARAGVGELTVVDFDKIHETNINRQLFALHSTVGQFKTQAAEKRILDIAPDITVHPITCQVHAETLPTLLELPFDFVVDAIDALHPKTLLIEALLARDIPFISAMGAARKTDPSRIRFSVLEKTKECPLAFFLRKRLRRRGVSLKFPVVFSDEVVPGQTALGPLEGDVSGQRERHVMGSLPTITGIFGLYCAHYALMYLKDGKKNG